MNAASMYQDIILDYYRNPKLFGKLQPCDIVSRDVNPVCGDVVEINIRVGKEKEIEDIRFSGKGCAISQAAASMLAESLLGKKLDHVVKLTRDDCLGMLGIPISMMRLKCALLPLKVVKMGVYSHLGQALEENVYGES